MTSITRLMAIVSVWLLAYPARALDGPLAADTHVCRTQPSVNFGAALTLSIAPGRLALVRFDLTTLPAATPASRAVKANMILFFNRVNVPGKIELMTILTDWNESTVTHATLPALMSSLVKGALTNPLPRLDLGVGASMTAPRTSVAFDSKESTGAGHATA